MMTANLTLPGDFAFDTVIKLHQWITLQSSMIPEDPSLQNRRRQVQCKLGSVTVSIT